MTIDDDVTINGWLFTISHWFFCYRSRSSLPISSASSSASSSLSLSLDFLLSIRLRTRIQSQWMDTGHNRVPRMILCRVRKSSFLSLLRKLNVFFFWIETREANRNRIENEDYDDADHLDDVFVDRDLFWIFITFHLVSIIIFDDF